MGLLFRDNTSAPLAWLVRATSSLVITAAVFASASVMAQPSLNQAAYVQGSTRYVFGHNSIPNIPVAGQPNDTDGYRWGMLHDGTDYRLYFMKAGTNDKIYQFGFDRPASTYVWGHNSIPEISIVGTPGDADTRSFAMLHDGTDYRFYFKSKSQPDSLHQFGFNRQTNQYEYGHNSIPQITIAGSPGDADWNRWGMLHDGTDYRLYCGRKNSSNQIHQFAFDRSANQYKYGFNSIPVMDIDGIPANSNRGQFSMLHDGTDFRFYFQTK